MFGARKRCLIRQKLEILRFFSLFYFYLDRNVSLKQQKNSIFLFIRESLRREKFYFGRFAKVYVREMQKFREFFRSRKFLLVKVSSPKVCYAGFDLVTIIVCLACKHFITLDSGHERFYEISFRNGRTYSIYGAYNLCFYQILMVRV